jgi:nucleoside-triphosphatase THEP1
VNDNDNPFSEERINSLAFRFPKGMDWDRLMARLAEQKYFASIVGPQGSGKTTLLRELVPRLEGLGFRPKLFRLETEVGMREKERLPEMLRRVTKPDFILLDGAEQLSTRQWLVVRSAANMAAGFLITVHRTSRLPTLMECEANVTLLEDLVHELSGADLPVGEAEVLLQRHRGDIRSVLGELRERWTGAE